MRSFVRFFQGQDEPDHRNRSDNNDSQKQSGVSKEIGEYVDYEEVD